MRSDVFPGDACVVSTKQNGAISQMSPEQINYTFNCDFNPKRSIKIYEVFQSVLCHRFWHRALVICSDISEDRFALKIDSVLASKRRIM